MSRMTSSWTRPRYLQSWTASSIHRGGRWAESYTEGTEGAPSRTSSSRTSVMRRSGSGGRGAAPGELREPAVQRPRAGVPGVLAREGAPPEGRVGSRLRLRHRRADLAGELLRGRAEADDAEALPGEGLQGAHRRGHDGAPGGRGLVELDGIGGVGQLREPEGDDLDVEAAPELGHLAVGTLALQDDLRPPRHPPPHLLHPAPDLQP